MKLQLNTKLPINILRKKEKWSSKIPTETVESDVVTYTNKLTDVSVSVSFSKF